MNKILKSMLLVALVCPVIHSKAQSDIDAMRYSQVQLAATARSLSMGNAFGALGADFSTLSTNPAGIGVYRKSEFTFTPAFGSTSTETSFFGNKSTDNKSNFNIGNLGFVWAYPKEKKSGWKGWAFGIGYNKLNSYHSRSSYQGVNKSNSLLDSYVESANGISYDQLSNPPTNFTSDLGWQTYLIDTLPGTTNQYFSAIPDAGSLQRRSRETRGSAGEVVLSFGGNYNDKIYWGVTLGFPYFRYNEDVIYEEIDHDNSIEQTTPGIDSSYAEYFNFKTFSLDQRLATSGNGFNVKFGLIIRPNDMVRIGAAIHSPTYYNLHDEYISTMHSQFESGTLEPYQTPLGIFDYELTTPFKAIGSLALVNQQLGIVSFEYEFMDYSAVSLDGNGYSFFDENQKIENVYSQAHNFRAGAEYKYKIFAFRAGVGYYDGLLKSNLSSTETDQHKFVYSGGVGIREEKYFVDIGYAYTAGNEFYRPYLLADEIVEGVYSKINDHKILVTIGFRF
ncbi:MAG: OmpP1/FadL family transporter [Bacteroidia bacterium]